MSSRSPILSRLTSRILLGMTGGYNRGARHHCLHFSERNIAREVFQSAIRGDNDPLRTDILQGTPDTIGNHLWAFNGHIRKIKHSEDDGLLWQLAKYGAVEIRLGGLNGYLLHG